MAPERAVAELTRVLAPGGILVAFDNDWETFSISLDDRELAGRIHRCWRENFAAGRVGRDLPRIFSGCRLAGVVAEPRALTLTVLTDAEEVFDLHHLLDRMIQTGELSSREVEEIHAEFTARAAAGTFSAGYTGYLVHGRKNR